MPPCRTFEAAKQRSLGSDCQRHGIITAFSSIQEFQDQFHEVFDLFHNSPDMSPR